MTSQLKDSKQLQEIINSKNISLDFLNIRLENIVHDSSEEYTSEEKHLFNKFFFVYKYPIKTIFELLANSEKELSMFSKVGRFSIDKLKIFFSKHNCSLGMFKGYSLACFNSLVTDNTSIDSLTEKEKQLALHLINELVKDTQDDNELGKEIRRIFSAIN
jgi:hypothetical protein